LEFGNVTPHASVVCRVGEEARRHFLFLANEWPEPLYMGVTSRTC
jgi:hypothetical protein